MTMAGEKIKPVGEPQAGESSAKDKSKKSGKKSAQAPSANAPIPQPEVKTAETRLKELDTLKKQGLVNKKEYEEKKKEILKGL